MIHEWRWPPRPELAVAPSLLPYYASLGWIAQIKKNGTCSLAFVDSDGVVTFKTRDGDDHKQWVPTEEITAFFAQYPDSVFVFELLHNKHPSVKNTAYVFDVLRFKGRDMTATTLTFRLILLNEVFMQQAILSPRIQLVKTYWGACDEPAFTTIFKNLVDPIDEGLVLKDPNALLEDPRNKSANQGWQVKVRKPTKNFSF
jgi:hypothetical protein